MPQSTSLSIILAEASDFGKRPVPFGVRRRNREDVNKVFILRDCEKSKGHEVVATVISILLIFIDIGC